MKEDRTIDLHKAPFSEEIGCFNACMSESIRSTGGVHAEWINVTSS